MANRSEASPRPTWLVEQYRPGADVGELRRSASIVRATALEMERHGAPVHYLGTAVIPVDEALLGLIVAASEDAVRAIYAKAGVPVERVSIAVVDRRGRAGTTLAKEYDQ